MSKTLLIVEDDRSLARLWTELFSAEGFIVLTEKDGEWALKTATSREVDFLILDVLVPVRNGFQVAERLRANEKTAELPILMVSGIYRSARHRSEAMSKYGLVDYLDKPVRNDDLVGVVRRYFGDDYPSAKTAERERKRIEKLPAEDFATDAARAEVADVERSAVHDFRGQAVGRGDLRQRPFPELLADIYRWRATGALLLKRGRAKKIIYVKAGYPVSAKSNLLTECLGKVMVRERMITEVQCEESLELMRISGRQQGTVLIEMGLISPHNLVFALELQLLQKLQDVFGWRTGTYHFTAKNELPPQTVTLESGPAALIWQGVQEKWTGERARGALGNVEDYFAVPSADPLYAHQDMELGVDEENFLIKINGRRPVSELLAMELLAEGEAWKLLYALSAAQMIEIRPKPLARGEYVPGFQKAPPPLPGAKPADRKSAKQKGGGPLPPPIPEAPLPSADEREQKERLASMLGSMRKQSHFEVLGVSRSAGAAEIRKAYFALARSYHPDKASHGVSDELKLLAAEIYERLTYAYEVLADPEERKHYEQHLASGSRKKEASDQVSRILAAEGKFQRGEGYLRKGKWALAHDAFGEAVSLYPEEGEFHAYLGWSLFQTAPSDTKVIDRALDHIMQAIQLNPKVDKAYLFLGYIYKAQGRADKAEKQFEKAMQCNPDCTEALRELRLYQGRARS
ncbi:MAG: response regulator [Deltaproteobacteria bacterium]|nr:response regulator [Deltaproteobacteria bacterium]